MITRSNHIAATDVRSCGICSYEHSRAHCPVCGAQRVFVAAPVPLASTPEFPGTIAITMRNVVNGRELVAAYRSNIAFSVIR